MKLAICRIVTLPTNGLSSLATLLSIADDSRYKEILVKNDDGTAAGNTNTDLIRFAGTVEKALFDATTIALTALPGIRVNEAVPLPNSDADGSEFNLTEVFLGSVTAAQKAMIWLFD